MKRYNELEQRTPEWYHLRKGKIGGTGLAKILGTPYARGEYFYEIIAERLTTGNAEAEEYENPMDRGLRLEDEAIAAFEFETGKKVEKVGLCEDSENSQITNSPDGLIGDDEAVEIKCMGGKNHIKFWLDNEVPKEYIWQVIQYFVVNKNLKTLWFVGYNPDIPVRPLHIVEVKRSDKEKEIEKARKAQEEFIEEVNEKLKEIIKL